MSQYYKILNEDLCHHGFQYKIGLNIDTVPFNPSGSCEPGGLYFTTKEHICKFLDYGIYIAEITIPEDAEIYEDPEGYKFKSDKLIIEKYYSIEEWEEWYNNEFCLEAVRQNGYVLQYVQNQTEEICMEAVHENGNALQYVENQTYFICMESILQDALALKYVKNQTNELCLEAVKENIEALQFVEILTDEIRLEANKSK